LIFSTKFSEYFVKICIFDYSSGWDY